MMSVGPLFKGKATLTMERWHFWEKRFGEVTKLLDVEAETSALKAQIRMKNI